MWITIERWRASKIERTLGPLRCGSKAVTLLAILLAGSNRPPAFSRYHFNIWWIKNLFSSLNDKKKRQPRISTKSFLLCNEFVNFIQYYLHSLTDAFRTRRSRRRRLFHNHFAIVQALSLLIVLWFVQVFRCCTSVSLVVFWVFSLPSSIQVLQNTRRQSESLSADGCYVAVCHFSLNQVVNILSRVSPMVSWLQITSNAKKGRCNI